MLLDLTDCRIARRGENEDDQPKPISSNGQTATIDLEQCPQKDKNLLDEGSEREERERLRDLDNNVPRAA
jgi:hypothetical protein